MEYFIGIVPPNEIQEKIIDFRKKYFDKKVIEPHITIKAQGGLTKDKRWLGKIEDYLERQTPFTIKLSNPGKFRNDLVYLGVISDKIKIIHEGLVEIVIPSEKERREYHENIYFVPHLSLGQLRWGVSEEQLKKMEFEAKKELIFPEFEATFARIYVRSEQDVVWKKFKDVPLKK